MNIELRQGDFIAALELERDLVRRRDELHVAENARNRFVAHMRAIYRVPDSYTLVNWATGFEPPAEEEPDDRQDDQ